MGHEGRFAGVEIKDFNEDDFVGQFYAFWKKNYKEIRNRKKVLAAFLAASPWRQEGTAFLDYLNSLLQSKASKKGWRLRKEKKQKAAIAQEKETLKQNRADLLNLSRRLAKAGPRAIRNARERRERPMLNL